MSNDEEPNHDSDEKDELHENERACDHCGWPLGDTYSEVVRWYHKECIPGETCWDQQTNVEIGIKLRGLWRDVEKFRNQTTKIADENDLLVEKITEKELIGRRKDRFSTIGKIRCIFLDGERCTGGAENNMSYHPDDIVQKKYCISNTFTSCPRYIGYMEYLTIRGQDC